MCFFMCEAYRREEERDRLIGSDLCLVEGNGSFQH